MNSKNLLESIERSHLNFDCTILPGVFNFALKSRAFLINILTDIGICLSENEIFDFLNGKYYHPICKFVTLESPPFSDCQTISFKMKKGENTKFVEAKNLNEASLYLLGETIFGDASLRNFTKLNEKSSSYLSEIFLIIEIGSFVSREMRISNFNSIEEVEEWFSVKRKILLEKEKMNLEGFLRGRKLFEFVVKIIL